MSSEGPADRREGSHKTTAAPGGGGEGNGAASGAAVRVGNFSDRRLRLNPNKDHKPESYADVRSDLDPGIYSALERHLPPSMLELPKDVKFQFMREILSKYLPEGERNRVQKHKEYRQKISEKYKPLHKEIYNMHPSSFFVPSFLEAINDNTEESFRSIISEPSPGIYTFQMLQPKICDMLLSEVENFEKWVHEARFRIMRPNTMNKYGAVLDDFGLEPMLDKLMDEFVCPLSKVFFNNVGGSSLDSHHGFVVEYGQNRDLELGFHVDDSEVTLNVCLGKQFTGGELFFRGVRCDRHVNSEYQLEESYDYSHVPGQAVLHRGRHRHGARATTSGHRVNLLMWCRSSVFREIKKYQKDFSSWCGECLREKKERQRQAVVAMRKELFNKEGEPVN
ncbi:putative PKHD-type hydroxylase [Acorus calamus]|uniref:PKHD-type hydroxylase n=1 Tax=Acorus calamus TaxID=4465 RepID=A0AAV9FHN3_ACOCL|nr:putative PKHD-type hydroxylase [Acorus calamus]